MREYMTELNIIDAIGEGLFLNKEEEAIGACVPISPPRKEAYYDNSNACF
jgi:hypothetical protein